MSLFVTFLTTCLVGVETGVAVGVGLSLFVLIVRVAAPNYAVLGNVPGTSAYHDVKVRGLVPRGSWGDGIWRERAQGRGGRSERACWFLQACFLAQMHTHTHTHR
jgi:MFS superfamily sulfate permease-like transporter